MAAPSAPSAPTLSSGPVSNSLRVQNDVVATATYYTLYAHPQSGSLSTSVYTIKKVSTDPDFVLEHVNHRNLTVGMTASNAADEESSLSTTASFPIRW